MTRQTNSARWLAALAISLPLIVFGFAALVYKPLAAPAMQFDTEPASPPAAVERTVAGKLRCTQCGWIELKRELDLYGADEHTGRIHQYTVRMADGSSREFQEPDTVQWRLGERLVYIDGEDAHAK